MKNQVMIARKQGEELYWERLFQRNEIMHFLPMEIRRIDGEESYCFHADSKINLVEKSSKGEICSDEIYSVLNGLSDAIRIAQEYLVAPDGICLDPDKIFFPSDEWNPFFCYFLTEKKLEDGKEEEEEERGRWDGNPLSEYLVDHVDHSDERAVKMAYGFDENCRMGLYDPADLLENDQDELGLYYETEDIEKTLGLTGQTDLCEDDESFYFCETKEEEHEENRNLRKTLIICIALILICTASYLFLFMNPDLLAAIGISQKHYMAGGAVLAAGLLLIVLNLMKKV